MAKERRNQMVVPVVLLVGIFIGGAIVLRTQGIGATILTEGKKVLFPIASEPDADPDSDGLKNWEEELYKTDPRNADTDGDGYLDGEEAASGYDPVVPAPNDALSGTDTGKPRPLPQNLTTHLSQILAQKVAAGEIEPFEGENINVTNDPNLPYNSDVMNEALYQIGVRAKEYFTLPTVDDSDVKIARNSTTRAEVGAYINAMGGALATDSVVTAFNESEADIIKEAIGTNDTNKVRALLTSLQQSIQRVKEITAPQDFAEIHKRQIAILLLHEKVLGAITNFQDDPALAMAAVETYPHILEMLEQLSGDVNAKVETYP